jgi:ribonucleoside-triphosphate reductase
MMTFTRTNPEVTQSEAEVRILCEVYSRIVGYLRPVQNWHQGKQQEFVERKAFRVPGAVQREEASRQTCD